MTGIPNYEDLENIEACGECGMFHHVDYQCTPDTGD